MSVKQEKEKQKEKKKTEMKTKIKKLFLNFLFSFNHYKNSINFYILCHFSFHDEIHSFYYVFSISLLCHVKVYMWTNGICEKLLGQETTKSSDP